MDSHYTISSKPRMQLGRKGQEHVVDADNLSNVSLSYFLRGKRTADLWWVG